MNAHSSERSSLLTWRWREPDSNPRSPANAVLGADRDGLSKSSSADLQLGEQDPNPRPSGYELGKS